MASCSFLFSQDILTEWQEISCENLESIHNDANYPQIWRGETESNQYVFSANWDGDENDEIIKLYKFTANGEKATLTEMYSDTIFWFYLSCDEKPYLENEKFLFDPYVSDSDGTLRIYKIFESNLILYDSTISLGSESEFQCFFMNNNHYLLIYNSDKLALLGLDDVSGTIGIINRYSITPAKQDTSILILKDTLYYFSTSGFCAVKISDDNATSEVISNVTVTDPKSLLVTDKQDKIWIMNQTDGVIEYNTKSQEAKKIAEFPNLFKTMDMDKVCFYSENYLYLMTNEAVYSLNLNTTPPTPPTPPTPKPKMPWIGPITPTIEGGYEFTGLAEFFAMLNDSYLSIICNGMPMMFTFDPIMHAFHLAPKAPHFNPANSNNAFQDDRFFYIYNPDRNTITCTDTRTGMAQEIACYEPMPQDIIQVAVANNFFYILTKSGDNHIARMAGANLEYVSSWTLDDWTPRTGASIVAMKNAIYVFDGKAFSDDSKEESNACYNELYVYDFITNASEKLEVDKDVTARYNAKILSSKRWGKLWIIGGKDSSDSLALDVWEYNTHNKEWSYINDIPKKDANASASYDEENDSLSLLLTPEEKTEQRNFFSMRSKNRNITQASMRSKNRNILQASSGAVVYQIKNLSSATSTKDQSGKSCGCLGLEFFLALAGLFILRRFLKA